MTVPAKKQNGTYPHDELWKHIEDVLKQGFTGQVILHCSDGRVRKWDEQKRHNWPPEPYILLDRNERLD